MKFLYLVKQLKYLHLFILIIFISLLAIPKYAKGVGNFFSSQARVTWDDGGQNSVDKRAYIYLKDQESSLKYLPTGHPLVSSYGCRTNAGANYVVEPGQNNNYAKGWYNLVQDANGMSSANLYWGAATVSWGGQAYERNCEYEYIYMPGDISQNQAASIEGDIFSQGQVVGQIDPNNPDQYYIAVAGNSLIESANDITGFGPGKVRQVGFYQLGGQSTSDKNILSQFQTKLHGVHNSTTNTKGFIDEYYNVRYDQTSANNSPNKFLKADIENGPLHDETKLAKNPDGDIYVIKSDGSSGSGDLTIDSPVMLPNKCQKLVYVEGNLNIKSDIIGSNSSILAFVAEGDITVDGGMSNITATPGEISFHSPTPGLGVSKTIPAKDFTLELYFNTTQKDAYLASSFEPNNESYAVYLSNGHLIGLVGLTHSESISTGHKYNDGSWHHVAFVHDTVNQENRLYVDGNLRQSHKSNITTSISPTKPLTLAALDPNSNPAPFIGSITQLRLTDTVLYNSNFTLPSKNSMWSTNGNTKGYWPFNEGSGSIAHDKSGNSNDFNLQDSYTFIGGSPASSSLQDVTKVDAGLISLNGTVRFNSVDSSCNNNSCHRLDLKGLVIGRFVEFNRDSSKILFDTSEIHAGVSVKYNPNIAKLPAFDQLLSAPSIDEASP